MALDTKAVADRVVAILRGLAGMGAVQKGVPEAWSKRVDAYVTMGSQPQGRKTTGTVYRDARFFVAFCYRVDGAEETAEETLMSLVDAFQAEIYADLTLAGTCQGVELDTGLADDPEYRPYAGKEFREYPIVVTARQYGSYAVNP